MLLPEQTVNDHSGGESDHVTTTTPVVVGENDCSSQDRSKSEQQMFDLSMMLQQSDGNRSICQSSSNSRLTPSREKQKNTTLTQEYHEEEHVVPKGPQNGSACPNPLSPSSSRSGEKIVLSRSSSLSTIPPPLDSLTTYHNGVEDDDGGSSVSSVSTQGTFCSQHSMSTTATGASANGRRSVFSKYWTKTGQEPMKWHPQGGGAAAALQPQLSTAPEHEANLDVEIPSPPTTISTGGNHSPHHRYYYHGSGSSSSLSSSSSSRRSNILHPGARRYASTPSLPSYAKDGEVDNLHRTTSMLSHSRKVRSESQLLMTTSTSSSSLLSTASSSSSTATAMSENHHHHHNHSPHKTKKRPSCLRRESRYSPASSSVGSSSVASTATTAFTSSTRSMNFVDNTTTDDDQEETTTPDASATRPQGKCHDHHHHHPGDDGDRSTEKDRAHTIVHPTESVTDDIGFDTSIITKTAGRRSPQQQVSTSSNKKKQPTIDQHLDQNRPAGSSSSLGLLLDCAASTSTTASIGNGSVRFDLDNSTVVTYEPPQEQYAEDGWSDYFQV